MIVPGDRGESVFCKGVAPGRPVMVHRAAPHHVYGLHKLKEGLKLGGGVGKENLGGVRGRTGDEYDKGTL